MSQVCLLLALLTLCCCTKVFSTNSLELVKEQWSSYRDQCLEFINTTPPATGLVCNRTFDLYACWPDGLPGTIVNVSCPWFLPWYQKGQKQTRPALLVHHQSKVENGSDGFQEGVEEDLSCQDHEQTLTV